MNCLQSQELLSAFFDGELQPSQRARVARHVSHCRDCMAVLKGYERLSRMTLEAAPPDSPGDWLALEQLFHEHAPTPAARGRRLLSRYAMIGTAAAVFLIALTMSLGQIGFWESNKPLVVNFDPYLETFARSPAAAQDELLTNYHGSAADASSAARLVGFTPAAQVPPQGFSVAGIYVLDMPCCRCPEVMLQRPDGSCLAVFEHQTHEPCFTTQRPSIHATCCGRDAWIVEGESHLLAASWRSTSRNLTIVGARDLQEVASIVGHFENRLANPAPGDVH